MPLTLGTIAYLVMAVLSGGAIFIALNLITCVSAFWVMDSVPVTRILFELHEVAKYPVTMYGQFVAILLTWLVPFALASFYPASYLLGRDVGYLAWAPPFVATLLLLLGYQVWRFGLRHYQSTGS